MADKNVVTVPVALTGPVETCRSESYLERPSGVRLYQCHWRASVPMRETRSATGRETRSAPRPILVLMHGFAEHCRRYDEFAEYLLGAGVDVSRFDARGHGRSNGQRGHVARFEDYVEDLRAFVRHVSELSPERPLLLFGHSNGGLIAIRALQAGLPGVQGLVLSNPLLGLRAARKPVPDALARLLSWGASRLPLPNGLRPQDLTSEPAILEALLQDPWVHRVATPRWYWSTTLAGRAALADAERVTLPLLLVLGELDPLVEPGYATQFYERAASRDKRLVTRRGELHEVLNETDRRSLFELILTWLERVCAVPSAQPAPSDSDIA